jgi:tRNA (guanine-N7-)-methyltransferase
MLPVAARVLRPGGTWRIASDDPTYQQWVAQVFAGQDLFAPALEAAERPAGWPTTRYEAKAVTAGRRPRWWAFHRR